MKSVLIIFPFLCSLVLALPPKQHQTLEPTEDNDRRSGDKKNGEDSGPPPIDSLTQVSDLLNGRKAAPRKVGEQPGLESSPFQSATRP